MKVTETASSRRKVARYDCRREHRLLSVVPQRESGSYERNNLSDRLDSCYHVHSFVLWSPVKLIMATQPNVVHPEAGYPASTGHSYLEWGAVFGGSVVTVGVATVLLPFGSAIGLSVGDPLLENGSASWNVLLAGLWAVCVALASMSAGGYLAGRMRSRWNDSTEHEAAFRDGAHGLAVWGTATVFSAVGAAIAAAIAAAGANAGTPAPDPSAEFLRLTSNTTVIFAFATAAGAALSAGAAWWSALIGGQHRDEGTDIAMIVPAMFRKRT